MQVPILFQAPQADALAAAGVNVSLSPLDRSRTQALLQQAVAPASLQFDGAYTHPKTWGVYEIEPPSHSLSTRRFRLGNHPVRQRELEAEFGAAKLIALFASRGLADELQRILNAA